jgi:hypothetical protein
MVCRFIFNPAVRTIALVPVFLRRQNAAAATHAEYPFVHTDAESVKRRLRLVTLMRLGRGLALSTSRRSAILTVEESRRDDLMVGPARVGDRSPAVEDRRLSASDSTGAGLKDAAELPRRQRATALARPQRAMSSTRAARPAQSSFDADGSCPGAWCRSAGLRKGPSLIRRPRRAA